MNQFFMGLKETRNVFTKKVNKPEMHFKKVYVNDVFFFI